METEESSNRPTARDARQTLRQLTEDETSVRYPPIPSWFFVVMSALVAATYLVQLLPSSDVGKGAKVAAILIIVIVARQLAVRYWLRRDGVAWVKVKLSDMTLYLAATLGTFAACSVIAAVTNAWWVWMVGAAVAAVIVILTGRRYRQEFGDVA